MKKLHRCTKLTVNGFTCSVYFILKFESVPESVSNAYVIPDYVLSRLIREKSLFVRYDGQKVVLRVKPSSIREYQCSIGLASHLCDMIPF